MSDRPISDEELSAMADALAASGHYRVQRCLTRRPKREPITGTELKLALFVDVETTGPDPQNDEIIELAMVPFSDGPDGQVYEVREAFQSFNQSTRQVYFGGDHQTYRHHQ